jgi:AcrR family transcriptional regulator
VAGEILLASGFDALTMEGVAQRAGVSKGLGYAYFSNAEDLALALHEREVAAVFRRVEAAMQGQAGFDERVRRALAAYFDVVEERGVLFAMLETQLTSGRRKRSARRRLGSFLSFWSQEIAAELGVGSLLSTALAGVVLSTADFCARTWRAGRLSRAEAEQLCADFVLGGLHGAVVQRDALPHRGRG